MDQADYLVWKQHYGASGDSNADGNGDGVVDAADYSIWRNNLGAGVEAGGGQGGLTGTPYMFVPEPTGLVLVTWSIALWPILFGQRN